jgi:sugar lactone lactonase YvrE
MTNAPVLRRFRTVLVAVAVCCAARAADCADDVPQPKFLLEWGQHGDGPGEFSSPIGLAFNSQNELFVTDLNNARVQKFSTEGRHLGGFDLPRDKPERKSTIVGGIAIDGDDLIYLSFMNQDKIIVYRETGEIVREWGETGAEPGQFRQPGGMLFLPNGELLIADQCNHRIQRQTKEGKFLAQWGGYGTEPGQFDGVGPKGSRFGGPHFLARDSQGRIYTTEGVQGRVQVFSSDGTFLAKWGDKGDQPGGFGSYAFGNFPHSFGPIGVAVDRYDRVLVSSLNNRVQYFDFDGKYLFGIDGTGRENGELLHPHGLAFDREGHLYIADAGNQRIVKFEIPPP